MTTGYTIADPAAVTPAERDMFFANGFAVVDRLVDDRVLAELRDAYDDIIDRRRPRRTRSATT